MTPVDTGTLGFRALLALVALTGFCPMVLADQTVTLTAVHDSLVREEDSTSNFGGAGLLCVAGNESVNGIGELRGRFDSLVKFEAASLVAAFDTAYGAGQWTITDAVLQVYELAGPENSFFPRGTGDFEVSWLSEDSWLEGTGSPSSPSHGAGEITWDALQLILATADESELGTYSNVGVDGVRQYILTATDSFADDLKAGGMVSLHFSPQTDGLGFPFHSRNFGDASRRPRLFVTAAPLGDMNCDDAVDLLDVDPYVFALVDPAGFALAYPGCALARADMNQDGGEDGEDLQDFAAALLDP